jgi:hypothetical protein
MFVNGFCDLHKQNMAANNIALPKVMNHDIDLTAYRYLWSLKGFDLLRNQRGSI